MMILPTLGSYKRNPKKSLLTLVLVSAAKALVFPLAENRQIRFLYILLSRCVWAQIGSSKPNVKRLGAKLPCLDANWQP